MSAGKTGNNSRAKGGSGMRLDLIGAIASIATVAVSLGEFILHLTEHREEHHRKRYGRRPKHKRR